MRSDKDTVINIHLYREKRSFKFKMKGFGHENEMTETSPPLLSQPISDANRIKFFHVHCSSVSDHLHLLLSVYISTLLRLLLMVQLGSGNEREFSFRGKINTKTKHKSVHNVK